MTNRSLGLDSQIPWAILRQLKMSKNLSNRAFFNFYFYYGTHSLVAEGVV